MTWLLAVQAAVTLFLAGLVWTIQVVHYPLFAGVGDEQFVAYEAAHNARITWLIVVPWAVQGLTTGAVLLAPPAGLPRWMTLVGAALAATTVLVTVTMSVPQHVVLAGGFDAAAHARLVGTNWLRTAAWTGHGVLALVMLVDHVRTPSA